MAGDNEIAKWREAGKWWEFEPYHEIRRVAGADGTIREKSKSAPTLGQLGKSGAGTTPKPHDENHKEDWSLRQRKIRDEKVSAACGALPRSYYERQAAEKLQVAEGMQSVERERAKEAARTYWLSAGIGEKVIRARAAQPGYAPLHVMSGYSFGRSVLLAEEMATHAALGECTAAAITDHFSLAGASEFVRACRLSGVRPLVGARIELESGGSLVLIAQSKKGYRNLSRLITECHLHEPRGFPLANWERLSRYADDLICLTGGNDGPLDPLLARRDFDRAADLTKRLVQVFSSSRVWLEVERSYLPWGRLVEQQLSQLAEAFDLGQVAGGVVTHGRREHFPAQDVLVCADTLCLIEEVIGRKERRAMEQIQIPQSPVRALNAERFFHTDSEMRVLYSDRPELLQATLQVAEMCDADVLPARTNMPSVFEDDAHALREIVEMNSHARYKKVTPAIRKRLEMEVERIIRLGFSSHFLVAFDMVRWAGEQGIQSSGRGSVVDSAVSYVLGFSRIDAIQHQLHFDRFLPDDGNKRPDIDIDFEARRRDEIRGYLTRKYGIERVATVAAVGAYCTRGIIREVGKVFGLPDPTISFLAKKVHGGTPPDQIEAALDKRPELRDHHIPKERFRWVLRLAEKLMDVPRNMRSHSSGVVISTEPIADTVPVQWSAAPSALAAGETDPEQITEPHLRIIQWDKRSCKHYFDKFDILCLRSQDVLSRIQDQVIGNAPDFRVEHVTSEDPETFRAFRSGELIGVPQSASPAMRQAHVRIGTENLVDASLMQAGIRPGVGGAVKMNELIARRRGDKPYFFEHPELERILGITYGIIVFQEQVDQLLQAFCGCSAGEAEDIRDGIHKRRREDFGNSIREQLINQMVNKGHSLSLAEKVLEYITGFKGYGFAQGHALAFAETSIRCVHLMQNYPAEYFAALLSSQPAGYYGPVTIANEARSRGVTMLPPCVNRSVREFAVEDIRDKATGIMMPNGGIRTGWMQIRSVSHQMVKRVLAYTESLEQEVETRELQPMQSVMRQTKKKRVATATLPSNLQNGQNLPFTSMFDFAQKIKPERDELEALILCGAFDHLHPNRRAMLWAVNQAMQYAKQIDQKGQAVLPMMVPEPRLDNNMPDLSLEEKAAYERSILDMDVEKHLMAFERERIQDRALTSEEIKRLKPGTKAVVVGNPIRLRFPPTPSGKRVVFFDLEDEAGLLNVTCFDRQYQVDGKAIVTAPYVTVIGEVQDRGGHPAFLASRVFPYVPVLLRGRANQLPVRRGDFLMGGKSVPRIQ
jgi:error-prone DNA polymerase